MVSLKTERKERKQMSNPIMEKNPYFKNAGMRPNQMGQTTEYGFDYVGRYSPQGYREAQADYAAPAGTMTYANAMNRTAVLLGVTLLSGIVTATLFPLSALPPIAVFGSLAAFAAGIVIALRRVIAAPLAVGYAVLEGVSLGALTRYVDVFLPGVALQAVIATAIIVGVTLALHYSGAVRTTPRGMKIALAAVFGAVIFSFVNMGFMWFGKTNMRTDITVMGLPLGVVIGVVMLLVAAYILIGDFEAVQYAVENRAPENFGWTCAVGIVMTILWIYVEVLRLVMILADNR